MGEGRPVARGGVRVAAPDAGEPVCVGIEPGIYGALASIAAGRSVVIDAYREWMCGTWIGDLTVTLVEGHPGPGFTTLSPIEGVPIYASERIVRLLGAAGAVLRRGGLPFRRGLGLSLERPALWIEFLENPAAFARRDGRAPPPERRSRTHPNG